MKKYLFIMAALITVVVPCAVHAAQIGPNPNYGLITVTGNDYNSDNIFDNENTINITSSGTLTNNYGGYGTFFLNEGMLSNSGTLNNSGFLYHYGTLNNNSGGTLNNYSGGGLMYINSGGTLNNTGTLNNYSSGALNNSGTLNNNSGGTLNNTSGMLNNTAGTLNNTGTLNNYADSANTFTNLGTLTNSGTLSNSGIIGGTGNYTQTSGQTINNGSLSQTSINVQGGILSGNGIINGNVTIGSGATVSPGNSPGTLTINGNFSSSGNLIFEIGGLGSGLYDVLVVNGSAIFTGGNIEFDFINGYNPLAGTSLDFLLANSITGWNTLSFSLIGLNGAGWEVDPSANGEMLLITKQGTSVPEPSTFALLGAGLAGVGLLRRRFKS